MIQSMIQSYQQGKILFIQGRGYEIVREMQEQGSQSINYVAKYSGNPHEQVIIKQYGSIKIDEIEVLNKIQKEQNDNKSKNKHIIKILGIQNSSQQKEQNNFLVVLEQGKNNTEHLINTNTSLNLVQKFKLFRQMTKGVKELHDLGYFHRDLKPENFVYFENQNKTYKVKLIDFGLARNVKNDFGRLRTQQVGTWNYMSPEVMLGECNYDKTIDIWSLGIILYKMLTKEELLKGFNLFSFQMLALTQEQIYMKIDQTNCMGQSEKDIIKCMLQKKSENRCNLEIILKKIDQYLRAIEEQEQKELQELENKKQSLIDQLKDIQSTIKNNIQYIMEKQQIINSINLQDKKKQELLIYINNEIKKYEEILLTNAQRQKLILQAQTKEMLKEYEYELTKEYQQYINGQKVIIEKITQEQSQLEQQVKNKEQEQKIRIQLEQKLKIELEQKLKMELEQKLKMEQEQKLKIELEQKLKIEKESYQSQLKIVKQLFNQQSPYIQQIQDQINFYQRIQIQIQQITQDILTVELQEKIIQQYESLQQQIATYQSYNRQLEEIQLAQNRLKNQIEVANECIQQIDIEYLDKHQQDIEEFNKKLIDYQEKYQYFSTNQKYANQITQIINHIGQAFGELNNLKQLISKRTLSAYQQYIQINQQIQQSLKDCKKQYYQIREQIYNDQQIELKTQERNKKLEFTKEQLHKFNQKMNQFKDQVKNLIKNSYCNNEEIKFLINSQLTKMDQNIKEYEQSFVQFNQLNSQETIGNQIKYLEEFQRKLIEVQVDEIQQINLLFQILFLREEKEFFYLNNEY